MRHAGVERVNRLFADGEQNFFVQPQLFWLRQTDCDAPALKAGANDSRAGLEREIIFLPGDFLHVAREATRAVAAHVSHAAVAVEEFPRPVRFAARARNEQHHAVRADAAMTVAQPHDLLAREFDFARAIVGEDKVIARSVHFGELQKHEMKLTESRRT